MSFEQISPYLGTGHGLSFDQRSILFILGHSLRHVYGPTLSSDYDERIRSSLEKILARDRGAG